MINVVDKRRPNGILLKLVNPGEVFILDDSDLDNIILGCVIDELHLDNSRNEIAISGVREEYIVYYVISGQNSGTIRARHGDLIVERVSLRTAIETYTP